MLWPYQYSELEIATNISRSTFFCVLSDECIYWFLLPRISIRWIDDQLEPHEDFIGLYQVDNICADTLVAVIKNTLIRMNRSLSKCRGQCYGGASTMKGVRSGVANRRTKVASKGSKKHFALAWPSENCFCRAWKMTGFWTKTYMRSPPLCWPYHILIIPTIFTLLYI